MSIGIKNCGLKTPHAIEAAIESGASFLGFILHPTSPRYIEPAALPALFARIPSHVKRVAVLVNPSDDALNQLMSQSPPDILQLHGDETVARLTSIKQHYKLPIIKAIGIATADDVSRAAAFADYADYLLLDTKSLHDYGGTGVAFDWNLLTGFSARVPWFLSGGLNVANVVEAVERTHALLVDVSSGIESTRGEKDIAKIIAFNEAVSRIAS